MAREDKLRGFDDTSCRPDSCIRKNWDICLILIDSISILFNNIFILFLCNHKHIDFPMCATLLRENLQIMASFIN